MRILVVAVGQKIPAWVQAGIDDFAKRMPPEWHFEIKAIKTPTRGGNSIDQLMAQERAKLEAFIPKGAWVVAMDERGEAWTTHQFAERVQQWQGQGRDLVFVIGGPDGIQPEWRQQCDTRMRLSHMTLPHAMARLVLVEQIYRAWSVITQHPYHRE